MSKFTPTACVFLVNNLLTTCGESSILSTRIHKTLCATCRNIMLSAFYTTCVHTLFTQGFDKNPSVMYYFSTFSTLLTTKTIYKYI